MSDESNVVPWRVFALDCEGVKFYCPASDVDMNEGSIRVVPHPTYADGDPDTPEVMFIPWHRVLLVEKTRMPSWAT